MQIKRLFLVSAAACLPLLSFAASPARAEFLCDCTRVVDSCSASVSLSGSRVRVESSTPACSRVDYLIEGQPFTALVVDGAAELPWPGQPLRDASIVVENCRVCAESGAEPGSPFGTTDRSDTGSDGGGNDTGQTADREAAADLRPLVKVMPAYPRDAWMNKLEGEVLVEFSVNQQGVVQNIRVVSSTNPVFDIAVLDAVSRFRYAPARKNGSPTVVTGVRERFYFRLLQGGAQPSVTSSAG